MSRAHFVEICEYGKRHSQCRCNNPDKKVQHIDCNMPESHNKVTKFTDSPPTHIEDLPEFYVGDLNSYVDICHSMARSKGWHDKGLPERTFGDIIALIHSELSEALEEYRSGHDVTEIYGQVDGKPEGVPIELADVLIRIFDYCGAAGIDLQEAVRKKIEYNDTRSHRHGNKVI